MSRSLNVSQVNILIPSQEKPKLWTCILARTVHKDVNDHKVLFLFRGSRSFPFFLCSAWQAWTYISPIKGFLVNDVKWCHNNSMYVQENSRWIQSSLIIQRWSLLVGLAHCYIVTQTSRPARKKCDGIDEPSVKALGACSFRICLPKNIRVYLFGITRNIFQSFEWHVDRWQWLSID